MTLLLSGAGVRADNSSATNSAPTEVGATNNAAASKDLTDLPLEQLMQIEVPMVVTASKFEQSASAAPSSTTVITAEEIKHYGYRTLADILASVPGFYVTYDRDYDYLGTRGVNLGDFNSRFLLLVNGHRLNNDLTDGAQIDTSFLLDVDLIERVEVIRGPGSVLYGNNAFFGVINVITRTGKDVDGVEAAGSYGTFNAWSGRVTLGNLFTNGMQVLLSGTMYGSDGAANLYYPQFNTPSQNHGIAHNLDSDAFGSFFGSVGYKDLTLEGGYIDRQKSNPTAQYLTTFDAPGLDTDDQRAYGTLKFAHKFEDDWDVSANVYYDRNNLQIGYPESPLFYIEQEVGQWVGGEAQVNKKIFDRHVLSVGVEYRDDFDQEDRLFEPDTHITYTDIHRQRMNYGIFAQGDFAVVTNLHVNAGIRYDQYSHFDPDLTPRAAVIYSPYEQSTFKLIYGTAFRDPNFLELSDPRFQDIRPEKISTFEGVYEQGIGKYLRSSLSAYYNKMDDLIDFENGTFTNFDANTLGMEMGIEGRWHDNFRARLSYSLQHTERESDDAGLPNSPEHLVKLNVSVPLYEDKVFAGLEYQYTSSSHTVYSDTSGDTLPGPDAPGFSVLNLTLFSQNLIKNLDASVSVYNLLNAKIYEPSSNFHQENVIEQDGISFRLKFVYHF